MSTKPKSRQIRFSLQACDTMKGGQAENALQDSEAHCRMLAENYRTIFENSAVAITLADENGSIVFWNKFAETLLGMDKDDLHMKPVRSLYPQREWGRIRSQNLRQKGLHHQMETRIIRNDQEIIDVNLSLSVIRDSDGNVTGSIGIMADITEHKRAREQLKLAEEKYKTIFENSSVAITIADEDENIVTWNRFAEALLGIDSERLYMKPVRSLYPTEEWRRIRSQNIRQKGMQHHLESKIIRGTGEITDIDLSVSVLKGSDGKVTGSIGIMAEIAERKRAHEQLRLLEKNYEMLFENSAVAITIADENENIVSWNRFTEVLLGMTKCDLHMKPVRSLYPEYEWKRIRAQDVRQKGMWHHMDSKIIRKSGEIIDVDLSLGILKGLDGKVTGSIGVMADITERKRAEEEKKKIAEQLQLAERLAVIGELAAGVAHELNNPLAAIQAFAQFLTERKDLDETLKRDIETIYKESQRASRITGNLLAFGRRHRPGKRPISINATIEESMELHAYQMEISNIAVSKELDPSLPITMADSHQMQQVFVNIIANAEQVMAESYGKGRLLVKTQVVGEMIRVTFADDGPGISEDIMKNIFDPFFTTKAVGKGTGLGLSICLGIVQEHGGRIYATSKLGEGATFVVEVPICAEDQCIGEDADSTHCLQSTHHYS